MYYITDIRAFLTIAQSVGYKLRGNYCVKEGYRDRDWNYQIKVNLLTGQIDICAFMISTSSQPRFVSSRSSSV